MLLWIVLISASVLYYMIKYFHYYYKNDIKLIISFSPIIFYDSFQISLGFPPYFKSSSLSQFLPSILFFSCILLFFLYGFPSCFIFRCFLMVCCWCRLWEVSWDESPQIHCLCYVTPPSTWRGLHLIALRWCIRDSAGPHAQATPQPKWRCDLIDIYKPIFLNEIKSHAYPYTFSITNELPCTLADPYMGGEYNRTDRKWCMLGSKDPLF